MSDYLKLNKYEIAKTNLDKGLEDILINSFFSIGDCTFLERTYPSNYDKRPFNKEAIKEQFIDFSGYEFSTNKFHIEDFTDEDPFIQAIIFSREFKEKWFDKFHSTDCIIIVGFQDDEIGKFATFTFHTEREGEVVFDVENLEDFINPLYIEKISYSREAKYG